MRQSLQRRHFPLNNPRRIDPANTDFVRLTSLGLSCCHHGLSSSPMEEDGKESMNGLPKEEGSRGDSSISSWMDGS